MLGTAAALGITAAGGLEFTILTAQVCMIQYLFGIHFVHNPV